MNVYDLVAKLTLDSSSYEKDLNEIQGKSEPIFSKVGSTFKKVGDVVSNVASTAGSAVMKIGSASFDVGKDFDTAMSQVASTMGKTTSEIENLRDKAKEMGATTQFTATQSAEALNYLALAGYSSEEAISTLPTVLNLASAGGMDLGRASDMVTDAMSALGLTTEDAEMMVDKMAKTASTTNTSVSQLGDAMLTIGATGRSLKGGTTELSTALGILANNGIKGAEGGTNLRNIIMSLQSPTDKASKTLKKLGVSVFDSSGEMRGLNEILGDLNASMDGMTEEQKANIINEIFNKADIAGVNALLANTGEEWDEIAEGIENSTGAAEKMAETQMDNVGGSLTYLSSAFDGLKLAVYDTFSGQANELIKRFTELVGNATDFVEEHSGQIESVVNIVSGAIARGMSFVRDHFTEAGSVISVGIATATTVISTLYSAFQICVTALMEGIQKIIDAVGGESGVGNVWGTVWDGITEAISLAGELISATITMITSVIAWLVTQCQTEGTIFNEIWNGVKTNFQNAFGVIKGIVETISKLFKGDFSGAFESAGKTVKLYMESVKTNISTNIGIAKDILTKAYEVFKEKLDFEKIKDGVVENFKAIGKTVTDKMNEVKEFLEGIIEKIVGLFDFDWSFPKPKMPHFNVNWDDLGIIKIPKVSVEWYAKAMDSGYLFTNPTVLGNKGFGEAGAEMVIGRDSMMNMISDAQSKGSSDMLERLDRMLFVFEEYFPVFAQTRNIYFDKNKFISDAGEDMMQWLDERKAIMAW